MKVGSTVRLETPRGKVVPYRVAGIYDPGAGVIGGILMPNAALEQDWDAKDIAFALIAGAPGADPTAIKQGTKAALAGFPVTKPQTISDFKDEQNKQVDSLVGLVYALLSLSVIVALLGIVNTLALSVHERTRELGLLRAVGMSRRQVRRMVRAESVITAAIGAVLGIVLGIAFAAIVVAAAGRRGLRVRAADRDADRGRDPAVDRGRAGGDPARAAGGQGRRAAGGHDGVGRATEARL